MRVPSPPVISATLSGFVIGVIVTLLALGVIGSTSASKAPLPTPTPVQKSVGNQLFKAQLQKIANKVLGPDPRGPDSRFLTASVSPVSTLDVKLIPQRVQQHFRSVIIYFRLNDHPLGPVWRLREAKSDVFALLKAIYSSDLPVYNAELIGQFSKGSQKPYEAIIAFITYQTAEKVPWKRWGRTHEAQLWNMLDYSSVDHRFA
jgi:hypothetical protein